MNTDFVRFLLINVSIGLYVLVSFEINPLNLTVVTSGLSERTMVEEILLHCYALKVSEIRVQTAG